MRAEAHTPSTASTTVAPRSRGRLGRRLALVGLLAALALVPAAPASADPPPTLWTRCVAETAEDVACSVPRGIATAPAGAPSPGAVYVADQGGKRIVQFTPWGELVRTWGWDVVASGPGESGEGFEICEPANDDVCKAGVDGGGAGQFGSVQGIAVDSAGDVYVVDRPNRRVQKFDPEGQFLRMWGKGVNTGTAAEKDLCTDAGPPEQVCGAGEEGTEPGQFGAWTVLGSYISIDTKATATSADDDLYIGDVGRIQRCDTEGEGCAVLPDPEGLLAADKVRSLAIYPNGSLFMAREAGGGVFKLDPVTGEEQCEAPAAKPTALAVDEAGNAYLNDSPQVRKLANDCSEVSDGTSPFDAGFPNNPTGLAVGSACFEPPGVALYASRIEGSDFVRAWGGAPDRLDEEGHAVCPPPAHAPEIKAQWAVEAEPDGATVRAEVNPVFWPDTSFFVQYATAACIEAEGWEAGCVSELPFPPTPLGAGVVGEFVKTTPVLLGGLLPATTYAYRFVAQSEGGGPVFGAGGEVGEEGTAATFTTWASPAPLPDSCPNAALRSGSSAALPNCRAYEMVSPVDKNGGDIANENADLGIHDAYIQASPDGAKISYSAAPSFGDQLASKFFNQYIASRGGGGWSNRGINAPLGEHISSIVLNKREVGALSEDLCSTWLVDYNTTPLNLDGQANLANLYRRRNCGPGEGSFETLTTAPALGAVGVSYVDRDSVQGFSDDLSEVFFVARTKLTADAASTIQSQVYLHLTDDPLPRLVSILPSGVAASPAAGSEVGSAVGGEGNLRNAVSADGRRAFWTAHATGNTSAGQIYLRLNPAEPETSEEEGGACVPHPTLACTIPVSTGSGATFWDAAEDGSAAIYTEGDFNSGEATLWRFDVATRTRTKLAEGVRGVAGASEDLARIYVVSTKEAGGEGVAGAPNLYLLEGKATRLVATLAAGEGGSSASFGPAPLKPRSRASRVTADGAHIVFQSRAALTGYDNTDADTEEASFEVFTYEAGGELQCVSCNPSGRRPQAGELPPSYIYPRLVEVSPAVKTDLWAAAWIPTWEHPLHASRVLSEDGDRIFFHSFDALTPADTNGVQDVYQWEAPGSGGCTTSDPAYSEANGGCLYLISTGQNGFESEFWDASASGDDVFFTTASDLVHQDPGLIDLYDARVGGGYPEPPAPAICQGEACQSPPPAPEDPTPGSASYRGPGDPTATRDCRRPARRAAKLARRAKRLRRAARRSNAVRVQRRMNKQSARLAKQARRLTRNGKRCRRANRRAAR